MYAHCIIFLPRQVFDEKSSYFVPLGKEKTYKTCKKTKYETKTNEDKLKIAQITHTTLSSEICISAWFRM